MYVTITSPQTYCYVASCACVAVNGSAQTPLVQQDSSRQIRSILRHMGHAKSKLLCVEKRCTWNSDITMSEYLLHDIYPQRYSAWPFHTHTGSIPSLNALQNALHCLLLRGLLLYVGDAWQVSQVGGAAVGTVELGRVLRKMRGDCSKDESLCWYVRRVCRKDWIVTVLGPDGHSFWFLRTYKQLTYKIIIVFILVH